MERVKQLDQRTILNLTLWVSHAFAFAYIISALAAAGELAARSYNFAIIWLALLVIAFNIGSHFVLTRYRTPIAYGFLIGTSFMMAMEMLTIAVLASGEAKAVKGMFDEAAPAERSVMAFSILLFMVYLAICAELVVFKDVIMPVEEAEGHARLTDDQDTDAAQFVGTVGDDGESGDAAPPASTQL